MAPGSRPRLIGEEPDYIDPIDWERRPEPRRKARFWVPPWKRERAARLLRGEVSSLYHVLLRQWREGSGWDWRVRRYSCREIVVRAWLARPASGSLVSDPLVSLVLKRAKILDPRECIGGLWRLRLLTRQEMRRVVQQARVVRAQWRLAVER